mgnify:CR=1 FL=1
MENNINPEIFENNGKVNISDEVVAVIASLAATEVDGVAGMVTGVAGGFAELIGKKNLSKGVKITTEEGNTSLDLSIIVEYGAKVQEVANKVQEKVKSEIEAMTDLKISTVNVSVDGINVPSESKAKTKKEEKAETEAE